MSTDDFKAAVEAGFTPVLSKWAFTIPPRRFCELYDFICLRNARIENYDPKGNILTVSFDEEYRVDFLPTYQASSYPFLRDRYGVITIVRPRRVVLAGDESKLSRINFPQGFTISLTENGIRVLDSKSEPDPFILISELKRRGVADVSIEPETVAFQSDDLPDIESFTEAQFENLSYTRKTTGEAVIFTPVPNKFVVTFEASSEEDPTELLRNEGLEIIDLDRKSSVAIVSRPQPPRSLIRQVVWSYLASLARLFAAPQTPKSPITGVSPVTTSSIGKITMFLPNSVLISFSSETPGETIHRIFELHGLVMELAISELIFQVYPRDRRSIFEVVRSLVKELEVEFAEPIFVEFRPERATEREGEIPHDPRQWNLKSVNAEVADLEAGDSNVVVVVVDMGADLDCVTISTSLLDRQGEKWNFVDPVGSPADKVRQHGTSLAGIIVGKYNPGVVAGLAPGCRVMPIKAWESSLTSTTLIRVLSYVRGYALAHPEMRFIINMSFGVSFSEGVMQQIAGAIAEKIVCVASAGNDSTFNVPHYPSDYDGVLSIAAVQKDDHFASGYSNYGSRVNLLAPGGTGVNMDESNVLVLRSGDRTDLSFGTSFAAPHVAAAAALVISAARKRGRELTPDEVRQIIVSTARSVSAENPGLNGQIGTGVLDLKEAIRRALG